MTKVKALPVDALYTLCDPAQFDFATTAELDDIDVVIGQHRALDAVRFGLRMGHSGYNVFALGPSGQGKFTAVSHMVKAEASQRAVPPDWCYINHFEQPHRPRALRLPTGRGRALQQDMKHLVEELGTTIPTAFESEDYRTRIEELEQELKERQSAAVEELGQRAKQHRITLMRTSAGFAFAPMTEYEEVLRPEQFERLPEPQRRQIEQTVEELQQELQKVLRQFPVWAKEAREKIKALNREIAEFAVGHLIDGVRERYTDLSDVLNYLKAVQEDIVEHVDVFLPQAELPVQLQSQRGNPLQRYQINLLVDNSEQQSAPVVCEDLPSYANLLGRVEHQAQMGTLVTDFTLIQAGALHRANGGYLILDVRQLLLQPFAWDGLKRTLRAGEIRLDSLERNLSLISTVSLEPEHIPLDVKVVLVGDRILYYLLSEYDPDFRDLFKIMADFEEDMERSAETHQLYARLFATLARHNELRPLDTAAVARLIEHGGRLAEDAEKVSTHLRSLADLLQEADYWAGTDSRDTITRDDIQRAVDQQIYRAERVRTRVYENIQRGTLMIDTEGRQVGQINGLSVLALGNFAFGQPTRITATTRLGSGNVVDIERETKLGGAIHSKGVLILSRFLAARYARERPLSLSASLVFEQSYGKVDGDSASLAELCALLSSIAGLAIRQDLAMTGSVNQHGQVQPIGGVNEKIEGFFDICQERGLTGVQGVLIPQSNVKQLMLRHDVVASVAADRFHVYPINTLDQAMELLTGLAAGGRDDAGHFPAASVNGRVEAKLIEFSELRRGFDKEHKIADDDEQTKQP